MSETVAFLLGVVITLGLVVISPVLLDSAYSYTPDTAYGCLYDQPWCSANPLFMAALVITIIGATGFMVVPGCDDGMRFIALCTVVIGIVSMILVMIFGDGAIICR